MRQSLLIAFCGVILFTLSGTLLWGAAPPNNVVSDADGNTAGGTSALSNNDTGSNNTAFGSGALQFNTIGITNTALGVQALLFNTAGSYNTALGFQVLAHNTTGVSNTASGFGALHNNDTGSANTASGFSALSNNDTGSDNIAVGYHALVSNTDGDSNIAVGTEAGSNLTSGDNNIYVGNGGTAMESDTMRLGQDQTHTFIAGIASTRLPRSGTRQVLINNKGQLGVMVSSARYKQDIEPLPDQQEKLQQLRPVTFHYKDEPTGALEYGLIAEEVAKVYPELVVKGADGNIESVQYDGLIPLLLNAMQQQQQEIRGLKERIAQMEAEAHAATRASR